MPMAGQAEPESEPSHPNVMPMADQPRTRPLVVTRWRRIKISGPPPAPWHERSHNPDAKRYDTYEHATYAAINTEVRFSLARGLPRVTRLGELALSMGSIQVGSTQVPEVRLDQVVGSHFPSGLVRDPRVLLIPKKES